MRIVHEELIEKDFMKKLKDFDKESQDFIMKEDSISTPMRMVVDPTMTSSINYF